MTTHIDGHRLTMPALPVVSTSGLSPLVATKASPRFRPINPSGPSAEQAAQGVTMLKDPKLGFWPPSLSGKHYGDIHKWPLTGARECDTLDDEIWAPHIRQGALRDCWFMGTLAAMALAGDSRYHPGIRRLDDEHVALRFGTREFGISDDLPFDREGQLLYARRNAPYFDATWPIFYEKAAASIVGGYSKLDRGWPREAFKILLGSEPRRVGLPPNLTEYVHAALAEGQPVVVTTKPAQDGRMDDAKLHANHTYAVRYVKPAGSDGRDGTAIKLWNPWGEQHGRIITPREFVELCDTVTTPNEWFGWGGPRPVALGAHQAG